MFKNRNCIFHNIAIKQKRDIERFPKSVKYFRAGIVITGRNRFLFEGLIF